jgi:hypothetical protein
MGGAVAGRTMRYLQIQASEGQRVLKLIEGCRGHLPQDMFRRSLALLNQGLRSQVKEWQIILFNHRPASLLL